MLWWHSKQNVMAAYNIESKEIIGEMIQRELCFIVHFFSLLRDFFAQGVGKKTLVQKGNEKIHFAWRVLHIFVLFP